MPVPIVYRTTGGNVIASYDWMNVVSGVGYRRYYACHGWAPAGQEAWFLTTAQVEGKPYKVSSAPAGNGVLWDLDFDLNIKVPMTVKGDAIVNVPHRVANANPTFGRVVVNIYHVSAAAVETLLGTAFSADRSTQNFFVECFAIPLTEKKFKIGEKLRFNIVYEYNTGGAAVTYTLYYDPATRLTYVDDETGTSNTSVTVDMPFKIDI